MSKKYIDHDAIMERIAKIKDDFSPTVRPMFDVFKHILSEAPAADVEPVRHGEWREEFRSQKNSDGYFYWNTPQKKFYVCSICGREEVKKEPYCNCGARMDGGNK